MPPKMRILLVQQLDESTLATLFKADTDRLELWQKQQKVERRLEAGVDLEDNVKRFADIA